MYYTIAHTEVNTDDNKEWIFKLDENKTSLYSDVPTRTIGENINVFSNFWQVSINVKWMIPMVLKVLFTNAFSSTLTQEMKYRN